jgi:hypothetical protein
MGLHRDRSRAHLAFSLALGTALGCASADPVTAPPPSSPEAATVDTAAPPPDVEAGGACNLAGQSFTFSAACDACLQMNCCDTVVMCFVNNPDCVAMTPCIQQCDVVCPPPGSGGGGGMGQSDGGACPYGGTTEVIDGGVTVQVDPYDQCVQTCYQMHSAAVATYDAFSKCYLQTCARSCQSQ